MNLWRVTVDVVEIEHAATVSDVLDEHCGAVSTFEVDDGKSWRIDGLSTTSVNRGALEAYLALACGGTAPPFTVERVPDQDWVSLNQASFPPLRVGRFFVHGGHYEGRIPTGSIPLLIDAATAFGTGEHGSTQGCLWAMDNLARRRIRPRRIMDMGTGTGVLALAAAKLWRRPVLAADIEVESVRVAAINARRNHLGSWVRVVHASSYRHRTLRRHRPYDLVLANILARPLAKLARDMGRNLAPGGVVVLAGLLPWQAPFVIAAHRAAGLRLAAKIDVNGWRALVLTKARRLPAFPFPALKSEKP